MLAVIPVRDGILPPGAAEVLGECGGRGLLIGSGTGTAALALTGQLHIAEVGSFAPGAWATALAAMLEAEAIVVLPASVDGRDLAPRVAAVLDRPLFAGAVAVSRDAVVVGRDGGLTMHTVSAPDRFVATLQPGARGVDVAAGGAAGPAAMPVSVVLPSDIADADVLEVIEPNAASIDLSEATRIVGGGAGLDSSERFAELARLGELVGASVGATRVITDRGWIAHERQIGTTGVVVAPQLYIAFGISGAVQHTSGLGDPEHVVSVNVDASCPMMQLADLAVVADANAVLHELLELLGCDDE